MAPRFWIGGSGNWSDPAHWSATSGGAASGAKPSTGDNVTIDGVVAGLNGGTLTVNEPIAVQNLLMNAMVGTFNNSGNHNVTLTGTGAQWFNGSGTGARTINAGSGVWTISGAAGNAAIWNMATITGLTNPTTAFASCTIVLTNTSTVATNFTAGTGLVYGTLTLNTHANKGGYSIGGANTYTSIQASAPNWIYFPQTLTNIITGGFSFIGSVGNLILVSSSAPVAVATLDLNGGTGHIEWGVVRGLACTDGTYDADDSLDLGSNSGITITAPAGGGGGGGAHFSGSA